MGCFKDFFNRQMAGQIDFPLFTPRSYPNGLQFFCRAAEFAKLGNCCRICSKLLLFVSVHAKKILEHLKNALQNALCNLFISLN